MHTGTHTQQTDSGYVAYTYNIYTGWYTCDSMWCCDAYCDAVDAFQIYKYHNVYNVFFSAQIMLFNTFGLYFCLLFLRRNQNNRRMRLENSEGFRKKSGFFTWFFNVANVILIEFKIALYLLSLGNYNLRYPIPWILNVIKTVHASFYFLSFDKL